MLDLALFQKTKDSAVSALLGLGLVKELTVRCCVVTFQNEKRKGFFQLTECAGFSP